jgi:hypothetical protein
LNCCNRVSRGLAAPLLGPWRPDLRPAHYNHAIVAAPSVAEHLSLLWTGGLNQHQTFRQR